MNSRRLLYCGYVLFLASIFTLATGCGSVSSNSNPTPTPTPGTTPSPTPVPTPSPSPLPHPRPDHRMPPLRAVLLIHQACRLWVQWWLIWSVAEVISLPSCKPPRMLRAGSASITSLHSRPKAQVMRLWWPRAPRMIRGQPRDRLGVSMLPRYWSPGAVHLCRAIRSFQAPTSGRFSYASRRKVTLKEA